MKNIVLIGMPGSGKSVVGKLLSNMLRLPLIDLDREIERRSGMTIPQIFSEEGEAAFRKRETEALQSVVHRKRHIIASGGGIVTRAENHPLLRVNSHIFFLKRPVDQLSRRGRPLSGGDLEAMYKVRLPYYEDLADFTVENSETPQRAAQRILSILEEKA